jgi:TRAP transporter TAXI family solute receptor
MKSGKNIFASLLLLTFSSVAFGQLTILSGLDQASQYSLVQDMSTVLSDSLGFKIVNKDTKGVADNFNQLIDPKSPYKLAILQADYLYYMQSRDMHFNTQTTKNLKVVVPLGYQQIHLVAKANRQYKGLQQLSGNVVAVGSADQGTYRTALLIKERSKVNFTAINTPFENCLKDLAGNKIAAFFIVSAAPVPKLDLNPQSMAEPLTLVPLENFNDWAKYYKPDTIYKSEYKWLDHDVPTFSVAAVLVVNESKLTDKDRTNVLKLKSALQSHMDQLKATGHPQWKEVNVSDWKETDWPVLK